ncbi:MAG: rRNA pseudouridine synthase [Psychrobium sp.]|nr:rRNA pseudouridine synthase [Psychrobium sp.]
MRLAKFISAAGHCSRRAGSRLIDEQRVLVDGLIAGHLTFVDGTQYVTIDGQVISACQQTRVYLYHKPVGIDCNCENDNPNSIVHRINSLFQPSPQQSPEDSPQNEPPRLFPIGRLDKDSHGLLLLTNDGQLCHQLLSPDVSYAKVYRVLVTPSYRNVQAQRPLIDQAFVNAMNDGVLLKGVLTKPAKVRIIADNQYEITLTQGLNRQIRRMAGSQGFKVVDLQRISVAGLELADLDVDQYRALTSSEMAMLAIHSHKQ